jgi:hypothetical protein
VLLLLLLLRRVVVAHRLAEKAQDV